MYKSSKYQVLFEQRLLINLLQWCDQEEEAKGSATPPKIFRKFKNYFNSL